MALLQDNQEISLDSIQLSEEQENIKNQILLSNEHFFITGKAGTGKSTLLQALKEANHKSLVVVAPTGVAALNVGGQTIHSLFRIPARFTSPRDIKIPKKTKSFLAKISAIIIDEISMVRADMLDLMDYILRASRSAHEPFGGVQMIMFGDLYQLPPVIADNEVRKYLAENYRGIYFFNAQVWQETGFNTCELQNIFRQDDDEFKEILNKVRIGEIDDLTISKLNERAGLVPNPQEASNIITLCSTNYIADHINATRLKQLEGKSFDYKAELDGNLEDSAMPTESLLRLKPGAQVMLLKNDYQKRWVNGSIAKIYSLANNEIKILLDGDIHTVKKESWQKIKYVYDEKTSTVKEDVVSSFTQYPLKLAWAVTIHKAQGKTFENLILDLGSRAFAHGQTYVALSRAKSLKGLYLKRRIMARDIIVDPAVAELG